MRGRAVGRATATVVGGEARGWATGRTTDTPDEGRRGPGTHRVETRQNSRLEVWSVGHLFLGLPVEESTDTGVTVWYWAATSVQSTGEYWTCREEEKE